MTQFQYKAKDPRGRVKSGSISANSRAQAKAVLSKMRFRIISIQAVASVGSGEDEGGILGKILARDAKGRLVLALGNQKPSAKDLIVFTKQFATMIGSGVPLIQAIGVLAQQQRVPAFGKVLSKIAFAVENGATLSESLRAFPDIFENLYVAMVRAGEASGNLDTIMLKLCTYIEKANKIKSQVKSAMFYPMMVVVVAITVISVLMIFVVPTFANQYKDAGRELPGLTQFVVDCSEFMVQRWYVIFGTMFAMVMLFRAWVKTPSGRRRFDQFLLKAPGFGVLFTKIAVGRFCNTMSTMLMSGVNILEALTICAASSGNVVIEAFVLWMRGRIEQGAKFSEPLAEGEIFPSMVVSMVAVGEATGKLDEMLEKISEFYEEEVDLAVKSLLSMIEPFMIVVIGSIVGVIVIAMYLPVFDMAKTVG